MDQWNTDHHTNSGLVQKVKESNITESMAERQTIDFLSLNILSKVHLHYVEIRFVKIEDFLHAACQI